MYESLLEKSWVRNQGAACTSAALVAALGALGARDLPDLATATRVLAGAEYAAPALLDYVSWPGRRAPLDVRLEALALEHGLSLRAKTGAVLPFWPLRPPPLGMLVVHLAWGQEAPGHYGSWGWRPLVPASYSYGGHSVVLAAVEGDCWRVLDPNHPGIQNWPRPGVATARTLIRVLEATKQFP